MDILIAGNAGNDAVEWKIIINRLIPDVKYSSANTKRDILRNFSKVSPNLILLYTLPNCIDWTDTVELIRVIDPEVPIVLISKDEHLAIKAFKYGIYDYLIAPVKKEDLCRVFKKAKVAV